MELIFNNEKAYKSFFNTNPSSSLFNDKNIMLNPEYQELYNTQLESNDLYISKQLINLFCERYGSNAQTLSQNFLAYGFKPLVIQKGNSTPMLTDGRHNFVYYSYAIQQYLTTEFAPKAIEEAFKNQPYMDNDDFIDELYDICEENDFFDCDVFISDFDIFV